MPGKTRPNCQLARLPVAAANASSKLAILGLFRGLLRTLRNGAEFGGRIRWMLSWIYCKLHIQHARMILRNEVDIRGSEEMRADAGEREREGREAQRIYPATNDAHCRVSVYS